MHAGFGFAAAFACALALWDALGPQLSLLSSRSSAFRAAWRSAKSRLAAIAVCWVALVVADSLGTFAALDDRLSRAAGVSPSPRISRSLCESILVRVAAWLALLHVHAAACAASSARSGSLDTADSARAARAFASRSPQAPFSSFCRGVSASHSASVVDVPWAELGFVALVSWIASSGVVVSLESLARFIPHADDFAAVCSWSLLASSLFLRRGCSVGRVLAQRKVFDDSVFVDLVQLIAMANSAVILWVVHRTLGLEPFPAGNPGAQRFPWIATTLSPSLAIAFWILPQISRALPQCVACSGKLDPALLSALLSATKKAQ